MCGDSATGCYGQTAVNADDDDGDANADAADAGKKRLLLLGGRGGDGDAATATSRTAAVVEYHPVFGFFDSEVRMAEARTDVAAVQDRRRRERP